MKKNLSQQVMETIALWKIIQRYGEVSVTELAQLSGHSLEEIQHILQILREVDMRDSGVLPLIEYPRPNYVRVLNEEGFDGEPQLTRREITALIILLEQIGESLKADHQGTASELKADLQELLLHEGYGGEEEKENLLFPEKEYATGEVDFPQLYTLIQSTIDKKLWLQFNYYSMRSGTYKTRLVVPDYLGLFEGRYYLWARERALPVPGENRSPGAMSPQRTWSLERMDHVEEVILDNKPVQRLIPHLRQEDPFNFQSSASQWIHGRLTEKGTWLHEYYQIWPSEDGDEYRVTMPDTGLWAERFALGHAREIQGWEEEEFRTRVRERALEGLKAYGELE